MRAERTEPSLSPPPSGVTEQHTPQRRRAIRIVAAVGAALAVAWAVLALAFSSGDSANTQQIDPVAPNGPPAETLRNSPQSDQLGDPAEATP